MRHGIPEITIGGVLVSPFVGYAVVALALLMAARPLLELAFTRAFSAPPIALLSLYVVLLALLIVIF